MSRLLHSILKTFLTQTPTMSTNHVSYTPTMSEIAALLLKLETKQQLVQNALLTDKKRNEQIVKNLICCKFH